MVLRVEQVVLGVRYDLADQRVLIERLGGGDRRGKERGEEEEEEERQKIGVVHDGRKSDNS